MLSENILKIIYIISIIITVVSMVIAVYAICKNKKKVYKMSSLIISFISLLISSGCTIALHFNFYQNNMNIHMNNSSINNPVVNIGGIINIDNPESKILFDKGDVESQYIAQEGYPSDKITDWVVNNRNDVFYYNQAFLVSMRVRNVTRGEKEYNSYVYADVGDIVEYQVEYDNSSDRRMDDVVVKSWLPQNGKYLEGTTKLYNSTNPNGVLNTNDTISATGINIGGYEVNGNAYVRFKVEINNLSLVNGINRLVTWIGVQSGKGGLILKNADVYVEKH